jgi:hypothetical protein
VRSPFQFLDLFRQPIAAHPLFRVEARRTRWAATSDGYRHAVVRSWLTGCACVLVIWIIGTLTLQAAFSRYVDESFVLMALLVVSLLGGFWLDLASLTVSVNAVSSDLTSGRWDLIRLTALNDHGLVAAKHAGSQLRVWRRLLWLVGMRTALAGILLGTFLIERTGLSMRSGAASSFALSAGFGFAFAGLYLLEPFWRVRGMTAFGLFISTRERRSNSALLSAFLGLLALWFLQAIILSAVLFGTTFAVMPLLLMSSASTFSYVIGFFWNTIMVSIFVSGIFGFHHLLERWSLRRTRERIARFN